MKPRSAKNKGAKFQKEIANDIGNLLHIPVGKDDLIAPREMGQSGTDVRLLGEAKERFRFDIECKCCERWSIGDWIDQARSNQSDGRDWLLIMKKNRFQPVVTMDWSAFLKLLESHGI